MHKRSLLAFIPGALLLAAHAAFAGPQSLDPTLGLSWLPSTPSYLSHITLRAASVVDIHSGGGEITGADSLTGAADEALQVTPARKSSDDPPFILLDFGREIAGRFQIIGSHDGTAIVQTGESKDECMKQPWGGPHKLKLHAGDRAYSPYSAFRYAKISFSGRTPTIFTQCDVDDRFYPVKYLGSFDCSDPLLTQIWYTGAYTAHLCMQEDVWDAPKRDRARWVGDLHVSGEVIEDAFLDKFLMEQTMTRLRNDAQGGRPDTQLPQAHVNNIPGYSAAWVGVLDEIYLHTGDIDFIRSQHNLLIGMLEYMRQDLDERNIFANKHKQWAFVDWAPGFNGDTVDARAATHMFYIYAFKTAAFLLSEIGDAANAAKYLSVASDMTSAGQKNLLSAGADTFGATRQINAMAVYSGAATPVQDDAIYKTMLAPSSDSWKRYVSPYYNNYVIYALSEIGHTGDAISYIRSYWGGMIAEGATTFWEGYDPSWPKDNFHSHLQADNNTGYVVSLCHGWSAGCTSFLTDRVLGVRPTGCGYNTAIVAPDLGDLLWAQGDVPTPHGLIHIRIDKSDVETIALDLPSGIVATIAGAGQSISINGTSAPTTQTGKTVQTTISNAGMYRIVVK